MKKQTNQIKVMLILLVLVGGQHVARAYYDPGVQRWINRDPVQEDGVKFPR
jgi:hypothetical protein